MFCGNGSDEILALAIRAFVERDRAIGYQEPTYSLYPVLAAIEDVAVERSAFGEDFGWAQPNIDRATLFFIANPNAPTSLQHSMDEMRSFCDAFSGVVVIDEAYVDFAREDAVSLALSADNVIVTRSLSKSYSVAGIRLGYAIGPAPLIAALFKIKDSYNVNALTQRIAWAALEDQAWMKKNVQRVQATRARCTKALEERGFSVCPSQTNFLWVRSNETPAARLFEQFGRKKIVVRHFPGPRTGDYLRITIGTDQDMDAFLDAVG